MEASMARTERLWRIILFIFLFIFFFKSFLSMFGTAEKALQALTTPPPPPLTWKQFSCLFQEIFDLKINSARKQQEVRTFSWHPAPRRCWRGGLGGGGGQCATNGRRDRRWMLTAWQIPFSTPMIGGPAEVRSHLACSKYGPAVEVPRSHDSTCGRYEY